MASKGWEDFSDFAAHIGSAKYAHKDAEGNPKESWGDIAQRVGTTVASMHKDKHDAAQWGNIFADVIRDRKFLPGGRYLYATGRDLHQVNNCLAGETRILTDKGTFALSDLEGQKIRVRNRFGEWEEAEVHNFGKKRLLAMLLSNGDVVHATADHRWWQEDGTRETTLNISTIPFSVTEHTRLDPEGIRHGIVYGDGYVHSNKKWSLVKLCTEEKQSLTKYFDNFKKEIIVGGGASLIFDSIRGDTVHYQPAHFKYLPETYTPDYAAGFIAGLIATDGSTKTSSVTISCEGRENAERIREIAVAGGCVVSSLNCVSRVNPFNGSPRELYQLYIKPFSVPLIRYDQQAEILSRKLRRKQMYVKVESVERTDRVEDVYCAVVPGSESFTLANGLITSNCFLYRAEDSREGWSTLLQRVSSALMTGGGVGIDYSEVRGKGSPISRTGGTASGPISLMQMVNEVGRHVMQGGARRSAIWAGLRWNHPDVFDFIHAKDWSKAVRELKATDFNFPAALDMTNVSVILDKQFFDAFEDNDPHAKSVYYEVCHQMFKTSEPGFSVDYDDPKESLRNACTEITSADDNDVCNLGSINLARVNDIDDFSYLVDIGTRFLVLGTVYSDVPHEEVRETRNKNRRVGLGLMGVHEWLLKRGYRYEMNPEFEEWLKVYKGVSDAAAQDQARRLGISTPIKRRAIAPTGTIGIVGETTTGIEPIFATAYRRRYLKGGDKWAFEYVVDPTARRLIDSGAVSEESVEDAYSLSRTLEGFERRLAFQRGVQAYVDHGISSTINLPAWGSEANNEGNLRARADILYKYLPGLRGITCYADGSRGGQPLTPVKYSTAVSHVGNVYEEAVDICDITKVGQC